MSPSADADRLLSDLQQLRENLDAVVFALSNRELASDRRQYLLEILRRYQQELEACLSELGLQHTRQASIPLFYFNQLDTVTKAHLSAILGLPQEPPYYEALEIKAEEYISQQEAFNTLADHFGFRSRQKIARTTNRAALALTLSGSLIQLSELLPTTQGARRYIYQNIYGNAHPPEGILVLDRDLRVGHRLRAVELTTSPVRLLREVSRKMSWKAQAQTFDRISRTLTSLGSRSSSQLVAMKWRHFPKTGLVRLANLSAAERVLHQEYGESIARYRLFREQYQNNAEQDPALETELLALCRFLQMAARELGFDAHPISDILEFITEGEHLYRVDPRHSGVVTLLPRGKGPEVLFVNISLGQQLITRKAPLALIDRNGHLVEITLPILNIRQR